MEINANLELLPELVVAPQVADSTTYFSELPISEFENIRVEATIDHESTDNQPSIKLPADGNLLPLDMSSIAEEYNLPVMLEPSENAQIKQNDPEKEDPVFLMTHLLIHLPTESIEIRPIINKNEYSELAVENNNANPEVAELHDGESASTILSGVESKLLSKDEQCYNEKPLVLNQKLSEIEPEKEVSFDNKPSIEMAEHLLQQQEQVIAQPSLITADRLNQTLFEVEKTIANEQNITSETLLVHKELSKPVNDVSLMTVQQEDFAEVFEKKLFDNVNLMINRNENVAKIQIDPPELGKIEITIEHNDEKTDIRFVTQMDQTKQLIENTLDKLKINLSQSGLELGQVDVRGGNQEQHSSKANHAFNDNYSNFQEEKIEIATVNKAVSANQTQLIDLYI
ncbi:MAG TPA: flagellar hook-length control protein FliK [Candidatus Berkiella sp.]|nr:flagellar hook-length control protein FliK [Candidatus Berkiella sp.]